MQQKMVQYRQTKNAAIAASPGEETLNVEVIGMFVGNSFGKP